MEKSKAESKIQHEIVEYFRNNHCLKIHTPRCVIFSVPNEGKDMMELMFKKSTGLMAGASELIVVLPGYLVFVEVKDATGRQSDKQKDFEQQVKLLGFHYYVVRSLVEFQQAIEKFLPLRIS